MTNTSLARQEKPSYAAKYSVEFFERKTIPSYALWAITAKDPQTGHYPKTPTAYGKTDTLEQAHLELTGWCKEHGLAFSDIRSDITPWKLVKDLLEGKSGAEWHARQIKRERPVNTVLDIPRTDIALVYAENGALFTDSLVIAERFNKLHSNVLRAYDNLPKDEFNRLNFELAEFIDKNGDSRRMIRMTWKGFSMLAMGFTGKEAYRWKQQFLDAFEAMGQEIDRRRQTIADPPRTALLAEKRGSSFTLTDMILETRTLQGKKTAAVHYMPEQMLCNWAISGKFQGLQESSLGNDDIELLRLVRERNAALIAAEIPYAERKTRLAQYAIRQRTKRLAAPEQALAL
jgi:Rha family phage regulatory protein